MHPPERKSPAPLGGDGARRCVLGKLDNDEDTFAHAPNQHHIDWLLRRGVPRSAIVYFPWPLLVDRVLFEPNGGYDSCPGIGNFAFILPVVDGDVLDHIAWSPVTNKLATRNGSGWGLGQGQVGHDGVGRTGRPLQIWRTPLNWLRNERRGVVIGDDRLAAHALAGVVIRGEDARHDRDLARLHVPKPILATRTPLKATTKSLAAAASVLA